VEKKTVKIKIFSYGGSGLKWVSSVFERNFRDEVDLYDPKHEPHKSFEHHERSLQGTACDKILVLYGDPRNAFLSFIRRGKPFLETHLRHMGCHRPIDPYGKPSNNFVEWFKVNQHFNELERWWDSWVNATINKPICFVKYEGLRADENARALARFTEVPEQALADILKDQWKHRAVGWRQLQLTDKKVVCKKFQSLVDKQAKFPGVVVFPNGIRKD